MYGTPIIPMDNNRTRILIFKAAFDEGQLLKTIIHEIGAAFGLPHPANVMLENIVDPQMDKVQLDKIMDLIEAIKAMPKYEYGVLLRTEGVEGGFGMLNKYVVPSIKEKLSPGEHLDGLSYQGVRKLDRPSIPEAQRTVIALLERGIENFTIYVYDDDIGALKTALEGTYLPHYFYDLQTGEYFGKNSEYLANKYFDTLDDGCFQFKPGLTEQYIRITSKPEERKYKLILLNYIFFEIESKQKDEDPLQTSLVAKKVESLLENGWFLLTTADKWFGSLLSPFALVAQGLTPFMEKDKKPIDIFLYQYNRFEINEAGYDQRLKSALDAIKSDLGRLTPELNLDSILNFWNLSRNVYSGIKRSNEEPYHVHVLRMVELLQECLRRDLGNGPNEYWGHMEMIVKVIFGHDFLEEGGSVKGK